MKVSVLMITYKHEDFIRQAIESILIQQTTFDFELLISNDCSPDNTRDIISEIIDDHSKGSLITYFEHKINIGMYSNVMQGLRKCDGKYIGLCEGDDYWTDPLKLQKQVDFLEANPDFEVCFTNIKVIDANNLTKKERLITDNRKDIYVKQDLPIWAPTLTRVFKNRNFSELPSAPGLDTIMLLWQSQFGKIKFINEVTGVYRMHGGGIYSSQTDAKRKEQVFLTDLAALDLIDASLYSKYFGMLFKKLIVITFLDIDLFKKNQVLLQDSLNKLKDELSLKLKFKVQLAFIFFLVPKIYSNKTFKHLGLMLCNKMFIY